MKLRVVVLAVLCLSLTQCRQRVARESQVADTNTAAEGCSAADAAAIFAKTEGQCSGVDNEGG